MAHERETRAGEAFKQPWEDLTRAKPPCRSLSSADLLSLDPHKVEWLIGGRLPRVGTSILVGEIGVGKSSLARELALCVGRGEPWLDFTVERGPVLFVNLEGELESLRREFLAIGLTPKDQIYFLESLQVVDLLRRIRERAKLLEPRLIVIDGLRPLLHAEELNEERGTTALDRILNLAREIGSHLTLVHDLASGLASEMGTLLASTQRCFDTVFMLNRIGQHRLLRSIQQRGEDLDEPIAITSSPQGHELARVPADPSLLGSILAYLKSTARLATQREIRGCLRNREPEAVLAGLDYLRVRGKILRVGTGTAGDPFRYTGFDRVPEHSRKPWLHRVRPWAPIPPRA